VFLRRYVQRCSDQLTDSAFAVPNGKSAHPNPTRVSARQHDPETFVKVSGPRRLVKLEEHLHAVIRMDDLFVGERVFFECFAGASGDGLVGWIYIKRFPCFRIDHPEDLLNVVAICRNRCSLSKSDVSVVSRALAACRCCSRAVNKNLEKKKSTTQNVAKAIPNNIEERSMAWSLVARSVAARMTRARQKRVALIRQPR